MKSKNKKEFELFKESLGEAVKVARGKPANVKVETLMVKIGAEDIKEARRILKVSQPQFAGLMMVSPETVKKWEQGKNPIPASVGYWAAGLKTRPNVTKKLLLELAGRFTTPTVREDKEIRRRLAEMKKGKSVVMHPIKVVYSPGAEKVPVLHEGPLCRGRKHAVSDQRESKPPRHKY